MKGIILIVLGLQIIVNFISASFSKVSLILEKEIGESFNISINSHFLLIIISTITSAFGKLMFNIFPNIFLLPILFCVHGLCFFGCVFMHFGFFRILQGFISGWLLSITFGLTGHISSKYKSFEFFTTSATILSSLLPLLYQFKLPIKFLFIFLGLLNFIGAFWFFIIKKQITIKQPSPICIPKNIKPFIIASLIDGVLLASVLICTQQVSYILDQTTSYSVIFKSLMLFCAGVGSIVLHSPFKITYFSACVIIVSLLLSLISPYFLIISCIGAFQVFHVINPIICRSIVDQREKLTSSSMFFFTRSIITAITMMLLKYAHFSCSWLNVFVIILLTQTLYFTNVK